MDIKQIEQPGQIRQSAFNRITKDKDFKQVFDRKLSEINKVALPTLSDHETDVIDHSDKVLNLLDDYANKLNNPLKTLKEIEPVVYSIENEMNLVESKAADIVPKNGEIEQFVRALSVTAHVAVMKFQRGDYV
ncbi:MAG: hypothetical protein FP814_08945 [Desulfobacterium sp.]|nr:hypothetical protein [Desulfobacterium sp.]MBU3950066.1 hypothetical protein [Pseudomonadota bacterium]MBU4037884.1 hypothetical protein [Pseudomonadota bacterium]